MAAKQLIIGLDAMEWDLVRQWAAQGLLPAFQRLLEEGAQAELFSTAAQLPDTVWTSLLTGLNPAKFEKYFYVQYNPAGMNLRHVSEDEITATAVWDTLSAAGRKVAVADIPHFPVSRNLRGVQLSNWGVHASQSAEESCPPEFVHEVRQRFGPHPVGDCDSFDDKPASLRELRTRILKGVRAQGELFRWLMSRDSYDALFATFSAPHCAGHHFWRFTDKQHPRHPAHDPDGFAATVQDVYQAIDREISLMLDAAGPNTQAIVVSGHGMGPVFHASWNLTEVLDLLGYGKGKKTPGQARARKGRVNPWRLLKLALPGKLQYAIRAALPSFLRHKLLFLWYSGGQDWTGCRAFSVPNNDTVGAIRISVKGRDKNGLVDPGVEYQNVCRDIADALRELTDPVSGRAIVRQVTILNQKFHGPFLDGLPDLTVLWDQTFAWDTLHSPRFGTLKVISQDARSGSHTAHGFALFHGPSVQPGSILEGHSLYDLVPTILTEAGVALPPNLDGQAISFGRVGALS